MIEPVGFTASVVGITTAAIGSIKFLYTTIGDIKDVPTTLRNIKSDLKALEPVLQKLLTELEREDSQVLLTNTIKGAVENYNSAYSTFKERLDHWIRHATKYKTFWAEWTDRVRVGIFEQGTINVFKGRLNDYKSTLNIALSTSSVLTVARQESIIKEVKDSILKGNKELLNREKDRADRELAAIESSLQQLSVSIRDEVNKESKQNLEQLLEEIQEEKASNEFFRKTCEEALLKTKNIHNRIEQEIKNTKADNNSKAVAGLINTSGEARNIKQNISDTDTKGGALQALELSIVWTFRFQAQRMNSGDSGLTI
ncbi:hypothetical protein OEA41_000026 [Lepraria neglecta]|uniref:Azaphilone pigments biosynthesis cluster protein L N-terminal domain-containing protein n=1 Tax=Lepraria neglecta TaxID=209136 RepID=A0AAE0DP30_9LECA|nr:hypothetical protein OEA41_000026 [Lepraria neglecta]